MWKNFFLTGFRNLRRNRVYSIINVVGLSIGLASLLLVTVFARHELTYDCFHEDSDRIFRIARHINGEYSKSASTEIADQWLPLLPGIEEKAFISSGRIQVYKDDVAFDQLIQMAEASFFDIFSFPVLYGNKDEFLADPYTVILTEKAAKKYFDDTNVVGQTLNVKLYGEVCDLKVTGVIEDIPSNSSINFDMLLPFHHRVGRIRNLMKMWGEEEPLTAELWGVIFSRTYIKLEEGVDPVAFEESFHNLNVGEEGHWAKDPQKYRLHSLTDHHMIFFNPNNMPIDTDGTQLLILIGIGLVILLLACINFTTMTIGRASTRQKEMGVRKVLGAAKKQLYQQVWVETTMMGAFALLPALVLADLALPALSSITNSNLSMTWDMPMIGMLLGVFGLAVLLAGIYPTFVMTTFPLLESLKGKFVLRGKGHLRRVLLYTQLSISITLCTVALVMLAQLRYVQSKDLGFDSEKVITLDASSEMDLAPKVLERLRAELSDDPGILKMSATSCNIGPEWNWIGWIVGEGEEEKEDTYWQNGVEPEYISTMKINIVDGRDFTFEDSPEQVMIVNQAFLKKHHIENPIGWTMPERFMNAEIIGVVEDFHFHDLTRKVEPLILTLSKEIFDNMEFATVEQHGKTPGYILMRLAPGTIQETINRIEKVWKQVVPEAAFKCSFVDEKIEKQYVEFLKWNRIVTFATFLSILIAVLGIIGMSVLQVAQRTKEIGIRKVCGASISQILALLTRETGITVLTSNLLALPVAWLISKYWLQSFAFRISPGVLLFSMAGILMLILTLVTVSALSWKTATDNPSVALRDE